jgi:hypothetical protein
VLSELGKLIPASLLEKSGAVFNTGSHAFSKPAALYLLGLNPGGDPEAHQHETVASQMTAVLAKPSSWAAFRDESWNGRPPGSPGMQPRILHLLGRLGLEAHEVPTSNLIFERTRSAADLKSRMNDLAEQCWPVHEAVIQKLGVRVILCMGKDAGNWICTRLGAVTLVDQFVEKNERGWTSTAHCAAEGLVVVTAAHPAIASWRHEATDPSPLVQSMLARTGSS